MSYAETLSTEAAFCRYEELRPRFPAARFPQAAQDCDGLLDIADEVDAFFLDSFGVLNVGDQPIAGAAACLKALRARGKHLVVLTNAASYTHAEVMAKYARLGFDLAPEEVVSSRDVTAARLETILPAGTWGAIAAPDDAFEDIPARVVHWHGQQVDGILLLSSVDLTAARYVALREALRDHSRPVVVANPDLVAPRETGLSKEPGFFAHRLADELGQMPQFFGKPFGEAFSDAAARLPEIAPVRIAMVGDTLHTDILGGRAYGARTVLVRDHGLFAGQNVDGYIARAGIVPDFQCGRI